MVEDKKAFPSTMSGLGKWIHSLDVPGKGKIMQYGLYTSRGVQQCDTGEYIKRCEAAQASGLMPSQTKGRCEGSHGFEKQVRSSTLRCAQRLSFQQLLPRDVEIVECARVTGCAVACRRGCRLYQRRLVRWKPDSLHCVLRLRQDARLPQRVSNRAFFCHHWIAACHGHTR